MARSPASLVRLWDQEGQASSSGLRVNSEVKLITPVSGANVKAELLKYYQKHGMENMAKEVGIIHANGDVGVSKQPQITGQRKAIIAVPVSKTGAATMSPFKMEQAILPKTVHLSNSPVILSTPQRVVANVISSPRTPQQMGSSPADRGAWSGKRPHSSADGEYPESSKKCKKGEKGGKGLRHFSMKVCEKVRKKGTTSYNEVADELVAEFTDPHRSFSPTEQAYDQKNIRRRVYDALNVLMAMNIISKEKKEIKWLGLPTNSAQEYQNLEREKQRRIERIRLKTQQLQELIQQQVAFKNLVDRNKMLEKQNTFPPLSSRIHLPFIIVNTDKKTVIDCSISPDKTEYLFHFNDTFQIHDDIEILKRMGMVLNLDKGNCTPEELEKAKSLVPKALQPYVVQMAQGLSDFPPGISGEGNGIKIESDLYSDGTSDFQEPSSSSALGSEYIGLETPLEGSQVGLSRQSSIGSLSDMPSRPEVSTPSEDFSDSDSDSSCADDV